MTHTITVKRDWLTVYLPELTRKINIVSDETEVRFYSLRFIYSGGVVNDDEAKYKSLAHMLYLGSYWPMEAPT